MNPFGVAGGPLSLDLTFDRIPPKTGSLPITATLIGTGVIANLTIPRSAQQIADGAPLNPDNESGRYAVQVPVGGDQYLSTNFDELGFTITFSEAVAAFGFFGTDFGDFNGQSELVINGDTLNPIVMPHQRTAAPTQVNNQGNVIENHLNASLLFYGLVGTDGMKISSVSFSNQGDIFDRFGFDNLIVVTNSEVPEPSSLALFGLGAIGLIGHGLRRRRQGNRA